MRTFLDIVNDMLRASREGNVIARIGYQEELAQVEIEEKFAETLDLINY